LAKIGGAQIGAVQLAAHAGHLAALQEALAVAELRVSELARELATTRGELVRFREAADDLRRAERSPEGEGPLGAAQSGVAGPLRFLSGIRPRSCSAAGAGGSRRDARVTGSIARDRVVIRGVSNLPYPPTLC
jgi:hypothetical protein